MIEYIEEIYTCGSCIYLACAIARRHETSLSAYLYYEDYNGETMGFDNCKNFDEIDPDKYEGVIIDHVYAKNKDLFYDVMGETKKPYAIGESCATLINISESDLYKIINITESELNDKIDAAYYDIDRFLSDRFKTLSKKTKKRKIKRK